MVKVMAGSHLIMPSSTVMRCLSPRKDYTTEGFLNVSWEVSGRIKNRPGNSGGNPA